MACWLTGLGTTEGMTAEDVVGTVTVTATEADDGLKPEPPP